MRWGASSFIGQHRGRLTMPWRSPGKLQASFISDWDSLVIFTSSKSPTLPSSLSVHQEGSTWFDEFFFSVVLVFSPWGMLHSHPCMWPCVCILSCSMHLSVCTSPPSDPCVNDWTRGLDLSLCVWFHMVGMSGISGSSSAKGGSWGLPKAFTARPQTTVFPYVCLCSLYDLAL